MIDSMVAEEVAERARAHAAVGEPTRLALLDLLQLTDRTPAELQEGLGIGSNLLAHHLNVLADAGLVERRASGGDRRRRYVHLRPEGIALLGLPQALLRAEDVVFVCTHNAARSQLAAALWQRRTGRRADSAGAAPAARVHPAAVRVARRHGLDLRGVRPRGFEALPPRPVDVLVSVCDRAREGDLPPAGVRLHWSVPDPLASGDERAFEAAYQDLSARVDRLAALTEASSADAPASDAPRGG